MSTNPAIERLEALKRSLEAARDVKHETPAMLRGEYRAQHEFHLRGLTAGLEIAIGAIDSELRIIGASQRTTASGSAA
jgi:soluble cytochrome b562